ncbi:MAG TPA: TRAP transporter substrate-binding protein DctP [Succinivibrionaceae bacterium]|nr:TRAP transporter substrate-binding protein [Succinivibrio sp.]HAR80340.1 TRAP transporter substrate-binding protein DctP [Succinivibrionaceae bacterium]
MRINKMLGIALAIAAATGFSVSSAEAKTTVRISHTQIETHPDHIGFVAFKNYVESKLGDKYEVQIFPNGSLGANEKVLEQIKLGSVQFLSVSTANIESFDKIYAVFSVPFLFTSEKAYEEFVTDPKVIQELGVNSKKNGFRPLGAFTAGTRNFYSKEPIKSVADLQGKKFRVQAGPTNVKMMEAFGASATPMSFGEVYSALQQGVIDGAENNELALTDQKHGEVCKYFSYDGHQMCPDLIVGSEKFLSKLDPADLKVFEDAAKEAQKVEFEAWHKSIDNAKEKAKGMGVTFIDVNANEFREKVLPLHQELLQSTPEMKAIYDEASAFNASHQ